MVSGDGVVFHHSNLTSLPWYTDFYTIEVVLPEWTAATGFRVVVSGEVDMGSRFKRTSRYQFVPTTSCLRVMGVSNYHSIFPARMRTHTRMRINNLNAFAERYIVFCENNLNHPMVVSPPRVTVGGRRLGVRSNPFLLEAGEAADVTVAIMPASPRHLQHGRVVVVSCEVITTANGNLRETVMLTEMTHNPL